MSHLFKSCDSTRAPHHKQSKRQRRDRQTERHTHTQRDSDRDTETKSRIPGTHNKPFPSSFSRSQSRLLKLPPAPSSPHLPFTQPLSLSSFFTTHIHTFALSPHRSNQSATQCSIRPKGGSPSNFLPQHRRTPISTLKSAAALSSPALSSHPLSPPITHFTHSLTSLTPSLHSLQRTHLHSLRRTENRANSHFFFFFFGRYQPSHW